MLPEGGMQGFSFGLSFQSSAPAAPAPDKMRQSGAPISGRRQPRYPFAFFSQLIRLSGQ
jgi:hypothetical protein